MHRWLLAVMAAFLFICPLARASEDIDDGDVIDVEDAPRSKPDEERDAEEDDEAPPPKKRPSHIAPKPAPAPVPVPPVCGDGKIEAPETCDDGNTTAGDGCSATCIVEPPPPAPKTREVVSVPRDKQRLPDPDDGALLGFGIGGVASPYPAMPLGQVAQGPLGFRPIAQFALQARVRFGSFGTDEDENRLGFQAHFTYLQGMWWSRGYMAGGDITYAIKPNFVVGIGGVGQQVWLNATDGDLEHDGFIIGGAARISGEIVLGQKDSLAENLMGVSVTPFVQVGGGNGYDVLTGTAYRNGAPPVTLGIMLNGWRRVGTHADKDLEDDLLQPDRIIEVYEEVIPESK